MSRTASTARETHTATTIAAATPFTGLCPDRDLSRSRAALGGYGRRDHAYRERHPEGDEQQVVQITEDGDEIGDQA